VRVEMVMLVMVCHVPFFFAEGLVPFVVIT